jgi:membrane protease YdiL (CAAX protease family)
MVGFLENSHDSLLSGVMSYFLVGLACAWLYWESRSILPGLLLHGGLNMLFVLVVLLHT